MEGENNSENFDSTITHHSVESIAVPEEVKDNYGEQKNLEITLRNVTDLSMEVGDGCQDLWHNLSTCKHQTDWNTCHVTILPIHLPTWQANNPWINPAWLFQEMNRVLKTRLVSLTEHNAIISRCNAGLFFQMQQDQEKYERQLQDVFFLSLRYWTKLWSYPLCYMLGARHARPRDINSNLLGRLIFLVCYSHKFCAQIRNDICP